MLMAMGGRPRSTRLVGVAIGAIAFAAAAAGSAACGARHVHRSGRARVRLRGAGAAAAGVRRAPGGPRRAPGGAEGCRPPSAAAAPAACTSPTRGARSSSTPRTATSSPSAATRPRSCGVRARDPCIPEIGVWHVDARRGPALRERLLARGLLHDTALDQRRVLREVPGSDPLATTEWWKDNVDAEGIDLPPPRKRLLIIDAGLAVAHPEFAGRPNTVLENKQDVTFAPKKSGRDHGTRVASIAGAPVNGQGISGVFPTVGLGAWDAGGDDGFTIAQELKAIRRGVSKRYSVVNMSFGSTIAERALHRRRPACRGPGHRARLRGRAPLRGGGRQRVRGSEGIRTRTRRPRARRTCSPPRPAPRPTPAPPSRTCSPTTTWPRPARSWCSPARRRSARRAATAIRPTSGARRRGRASRRRSWPAPRRSCGRRVRRSTSGRSRASSAPARATSARSATTTRPATASSRSARPSTSRRRRPT